MAEVSVTHTPRHLMRVRERLAQGLPDFSKLRPSQFRVFLTTLREDSIWLAAEKNRIAEVIESQKKKNTSKEFTVAKFAVDFSVLLDLEKQYDSTYKDSVKLYRKMMEWFRKRDKQFEEVTKNIDEATSWSCPEGFFMDAHKTVYLVEKSVKAVEQNDLDTELTAIRNRMLSSRGENT